MERRLSKTVAPRPREAIRMLKRYVAPLGLPLPYLASRSPGPWTWLTVRLSSRGTDLHPICRFDGPGSPTLEDV